VASAGRPPFHLEWQLASAVIRVNQPAETLRPGGLVLFGEPDMTMPIGRYFIIIGSSLLGLLFVIANYLGQPPVAAGIATSVDKSIIRIASAHKGPPRVVIDTDLPTIVPMLSSVAAQSVDDKKPADAFARLDISAAARKDIVASAATVPSPPKARSKVSRRSQTRMVAYRPQALSFFGTW
jgi:hypothetical protein